MRIGIIALLHESNTFSSQPTTISRFRSDMLLTGEPIRDALAGAHHEVGGFFVGLADAGVEAVPLFAARTLPSGTITAEAYAVMVEQLISTVEDSEDLDGLLVAPHGATVSEEFPDADGEWLRRLRESVGPDLPIIGTLDAHVNLSPLMVESCNALIAYRSNPHLDQQARGIEAANLMVQTVRGEITPIMSVALPPLAISIERQCTEEPHIRPLYQLADEQLQNDAILSNSVLLGFPYADVAEMGSGVIVIADGNKALADQSARDLGEKMWSLRDEFCGDFTSADEALDECQNSDETTCLLDMGDNVGGGSSADGTDLVAAIHRRKIGPAFACLFDPDAVTACDDAGIGVTLNLQVGGKTDDTHGDSINVDATVHSLHDGKFSEPEPRHGGITEFDQGRTAICTTDSGLTIMLTSRRMVPFSLQQLKSCDIDPTAFKILVAKGVNAPIAAYREACTKFIRVNTSGSTCADMTKLNYQHRRRPLFPLEQQATWDAATLAISHGHVC